MRISVRLDLPRDAQWVPRVRALAGGVLHHAGVPAEDVADVQLAVTEACSNVVRHAVGTDGYTVELSVGPSGCEIAVVDLGPGFDAAALDRAGDHAETGRGLQLTRALVDALELVADATATRLVLRKTWRAAVDPALTAAAGAEPATRETERSSDEPGGCQPARGDGRMARAHHDSAPAEPAGPAHRTIRPASPRPRDDDGGDPRRPLTTATPR